MFTFDLNALQKEIFAVCVVGLTNFLIGYTFSYVSYMKPSSSDGTTIMEALAGSLSVFTAIFGTFFYGYIADKCGRKISLLLVYFNYIVGGVIYFICSSNVALYISRALLGIANGARPICILYVSEVTHKTRRGTFVSYLGMLLILGILCTYISQYFLQIQIVSGITTVLSVIGFIGMYFLPETKYWYLMRYNKEKARESILWFDNSALIEDMEREMNDIKISKNENGHTNVFQVLSERIHFKNFLIVTFLFLCRTGCGREPLGVYSVDYFSHLHVPYSPNLLTLIQGFCEFFVSICCTSLVGRFKRRTLLFITFSILIPVICVLIVSRIYINYVEEHIPWLPAVLAIIYASSCIALLFPLVTLTSMEVISSSNEYRNKIYNISYSIMNLSRGSFSAIFPFLMNNCDVIVIFLIFLISNIFLLILIKFFVTETANKAFHECLPETRSEKKEKIELP